MPLPTTDLEWMFRDSGGVRVVHSSGSTWGHFDIIEVGGGAVNPMELSMLGGDLQGARYAFVFETGKLTVERDDAITVNGTAYEVRHPPMRRADGSTVLLLANA